jgi:hypothetical protein
MQALDSFISCIAGFEGDIPILVIPVLAWPPGNESTSDPSIGTGASALKTWVGKRKGTTNLTPQKKAKKATGPHPKTSVSTPPSGPRLKIPI